MRSYKVEKIVEELCRSGFDMTTKEFYDTTIHRILRRHSIRSQLDLKEYFELMQEIMELCAENDLKEMGLNYLKDHGIELK